jgi:tagatose-6-phosphate ketose/aldose isomerase
MTGTLDPASDRAPRQAEPRPVPSSVDEWLSSLSTRGELGLLLSPPWEEQLRRGYGHTLREIAQQPVTWAETAARMRAERAALAASLEGVAAIVVTGSGSSHYAAECAAPWLQAQLGLPVSAVPGGTILTHPEACLPPRGPFLVVSIARSGDSPESRAVVDWLLESRPQARHLFLTCNRDGALATSYGDRPAVRVVVLDEKTNDRSLVMTSSFTNLVLAARGLGAKEETPLGGAPGPVARAGADLLRDHADGLAAVARSGFSSVVFLGSGCRTGSAREAALKMLETNAGDVWTLAESFLGLRHGPMSAIGDDTLVVAFLASDPLVRPYELDLLAELDRKRLGRRGRVVVATSLPDGLSGDGVLRVECRAAAPCDDGELALLDAIVGQLLAFFRCLASGRRPDSPSEDSVITRVVSGFQIHSRNGDR